jgi:low temperature requirement protein LtrA
MEVHAVPKTIANVFSSHDELARITSNLYTYNNLLLVGSNISLKLGELYSLQNNSIHSVYISCKIEQKSLRLFVDKLLLAMSVNHGVYLSMSNLL